jgi:hypothetical protein
MIGQMEAAINNGNNGNTVSATQLQGMYANFGSYFRDTSFNGITLPLNISENP